MTAKYYKSHSLILLGRNIFDSTSDKFSKCFKSSSVESSFLTMIIMISACCTNYNTHFKLLQSNSDQEIHSASVYCKEIQKGNS